MKWEVKMKLKPGESTKSVRSHSFDRRGRQQRADAVLGSNVRHSDEEYRVGPGHPPQQYQFKPGQSGNPRGAERKTSLAPDLKAMLERALNKKIKLRQGEREHIVSKAAAGIDRLVNQFTKGDRHARRDLIALTEKLGIDLTAGQAHVIERALSPPLTADDQALVDDYVRRRSQELNRIKHDPNSSPSQPADSKEKPEGDAK
jgi:hypothetical protein